MPCARYEKKRLVERHWHKIVMHESALGGVTKVVTDVILSKCKGQTMYRNGGLWHLAFVELDEDIEFLREVCEVSDEDYRGKGDWATKRYHCASGNRF